MCSGYRQAALSARNLSQRTGTLEHLVSSAHDLLQFSEVLRDSRRVHHERVLHAGGNKVGPVFVVHGNPFLLQLGRKVGGRTVIAGHLVALEFIVAGQGRHAYAANSYEIDVLHTSL